MLGAARGTSTFPGSSWAEPPEGVAWTGETDWAKRSNKRKVYKTIKQTFVTQVLTKPNSGLTFRGWGGRYRLQDRDASSGCGGSQDLAVG